MVEAAADQEQLAIIRKIFVWFEGADADQRAALVRRVLRVVLPVQEEHPVHVRHAAKGGEGA